MDSVRNRIVVIGVGGAGGPHLECLLRFVESELASGDTPSYRIGICSSNPEVRVGNLRGRPQSHLYGVRVRDEIPRSVMPFVKVYQSFTEVLADQTVCAVIVCRELAVRCPLANVFATNGIHALVETPLSISASAIAAFTSLKRADNRVAVGHILPFTTNYEALYNVVEHHRGESARLGSGLSEPNSAEAPQSGYFQRVCGHCEPINFLNYRQWGRSAFFKLATQELHFLLALFGRPKSAVITTRGLHEQDSSFLSYAEVVLTWPNGGTINVECGASLKYGCYGSHEQYDIITRKLRFCRGEDFRAGKPAIFSASSRDVSSFGVVYREASDLGDDVRPLELEHRLFRQIVGGHRSDAGPLSWKLAVDAVSLTDFCEHLALSGEKEGEIQWPDT